MTRARRGSSERAAGAGLAVAAGLEDVLADARERAAVLRAEGHTQQAKSIETLADEVQGAMRGYLTWLSEADAMLRSGRGSDFLRSRFSAWRAIGCAELRGRVRHYRQWIVPAREHLAVVREAGRRGERSA